MEAMETAEYFGIEYQGFVENNSNLRKSCKMMTPFGEKLLRNII
jgi:hypothetical protein